MTPLKIATCATIGTILFACGKNGTFVPYVDDYHTPARTEPYGSAAVSSSVPATIRLEVAGHTVNAEAWDGTEGVGGILGPLLLPIGLTSAPDPTICVVATDQKPYCALRNRGGTLTSFCVNDTACDWRLDIPAHKAFALVAFDIDSGPLEGPWDFVDAVVVDGYGNTDFDRLDRLVRAFVDLVSPTSVRNHPLSVQWGPLTFNQDEELRREKRFSLVTRKEIASGFTLAQSSIWLVGSD